MIAASAEFHRVREVRCSCGNFLYCGPLPLGGEHRGRFRRCSRCKSIPVILVNPAGEYVICPWPCQIDPALLPWPARGWR